MAYQTGGVTIRADDDEGRMLRKRAGAGSSGPASIVAGGRRCYATLKRFVFRGGPPILLSLSLARPLAHSVDSLGAVRRGWDGNFECAWGTL
jgi:hypothetical protein